MEKKMYNKPEVEIVEVQGANLMINPVSSGGSSSGRDDIVFDGD
ncbi:MAG: hypothetical protein UIC49_04960 [Paludibacteraceae bacterium]|nr:hypothetical protein [Paludibacteraceae bacterium]